MENKDANVKRGDTFMRPLVQVVARLPGPRSAKELRAVGVDEEPSGAAVFAKALD